MTDYCVHHNDNDKFFYFIMYYYYSFTSWRNRQYQYTEVLFTKRGKVELSIDFLNDVSTLITCI